MLWLLCSLIKDIETRRALGLDDSCREALRANAYILWLLCFFDLYVSSFIGLYREVDLIAFMSIWMFVSLSSGFLVRAWNRAEADVSSPWLATFSFLGKHFHTREERDWADEVLRRLDIDLKNGYPEDGALHPDQFFYIQADLCINRKMLKAVVKQGKLFFIQLHPPHEDLEIQVCSRKGAAFWEWYNRIPQGAPAEYV